MEGRGESGGWTREIVASRNSLASAMSFVAFIVLDYKREIKYMGYFLGLN
jgi:hypothetical protein